MSADNSSIDPDTAEKIDKAAKLYDALEEADIDLGDIPVSGGSTRREVMQAVGAVALGSVAGGAALNEVTGKARAGSNSVGQIGTASKPVDLEAEDINASEVTTDSQVIGNEQRWWPDDRKVWTNDITDYTASSAQDAQNWIENNWPVFGNHRVKVTIPTGDHSTAIELPPSLNPRWTRRGGSGLRANLIIEGGSATATDTKVPFIAGGGIQGRIQVRDIAVKTAATDWGESAGILFYDSEEVTLNNVEFTGGTDGVTAYHSSVHLNGVKFGSSVLTGTGVNAKHGGQIIEEAAASTPASGNVGGVAYTSSGLVCIQDESASLTGDSGLADDPMGVVYGAESSSTYSRRGSTTAQFYQGMQGGRPSPVVSNAAYLDDGSGTPSAGWYITTDGGTNWTAV